MLRCPRHNTLMKTMWPVETSLQTKVYGLQRELETTARERQEELVS